MVSYKVVIFIWIGNAKWPQAFISVLKSVYETFISRVCIYQLTFKSKISQRL